MRLTRHIAHIGLLLALGFYSHSTAYAAEQISAAPQPQLFVSPDEPTGRYIFNIRLHTEMEIDALLTRAQKLSQTVRDEGNHADLALILHGSELALFAKENYKKYQHLVDKAAKLDADKIIQIKACSTQLREMMLNKDDMPSFIEIVPYGPAEQQRLIKQGYVEL